MDSSIGSSLVVTAGNLDKKPIFRDIFGRKKGFYDLNTLDLWFIIVKNKLWVYNFKMKLLFNKLFFINVLSVGLLSLSQIGGLF